ncbi:MAG: hypothetical protein IPM95_04310 [Sphingobacteriales bacterium]|nr:hypothetical protein [Sphingobacteriales bacterium]
MNSLPEGSTIIFVEDIIGTGTQSVDFIQNKINQIIKPSHIPYLFSLCATPKGIENVTENTHFKVLSGIMLTEMHQHYSEQSRLFTNKEKAKIKAVNELLKRPGSFDFDLGLMLAFYFTIPNNTMPIFWKDGYNYIDTNGNSRQWTALLPRQF